MRLCSCALWTSLQTSMSNVPKNEKREWNETAKRSKQVISWNKLLAHKFHICHWRKSKSGQQAVSRDRDLPSVCFSIECPPFDILSIMSQLKSCFTFKLPLSHEIEMFVVCHFQSLSFFISHGISLSHSMCILQCIAVGTWIHRANWNFIGKYFQIAVRFVAKWKNHSSN